MMSQMKPCPFCGRSETRTYRKTLGHDLLHAIACYCGAEVSEYSHASAVKSWNTRDKDYDALAAQRDEGLAREAELREDLAIFKGAISALGEASKKLCFNARTVTDGPDQALMDACEAFEQTITLPGIARAMDYVEGLRNENAQLSEKYEATRDRTNSITLLQQRLAEAKRLLLDVRGQLCGPDQRAIDAFLASPGCADGEKS